jgi:hypothetical protein
VFEKQATTMLATKSTSVLLTPQVFMFGKMANARIAVGIADKRQLSNAQLLNDVIWTYSATVLIFAHLFLTTPLALPTTATSALCTTLVATRVALPSSSRLIVTTSLTALGTPRRSPVWKNAPMFLLLILVFRLLIVLLLESGLLLLPPTTSVSRIVMKFTIFSLVPPSRPQARIARATEQVASTSASVSKKKLLASLFQSVCGESVPVAVTIVAASKPTAPLVALLLFVFGEHAINSVTSVLLIVSASATNPNALLLRTTIGVFGDLVVVAELAAANDLSMLLKTQQLTLTSSPARPAFTVKSPTTQPPLQCVSIAAPPSTKLLVTPMLAALGVQCRNAASVIVWDIKPLTALVLSPTPLPKKNAVSPTRIPSPLFVALVAN